MTQSSEAELIGKLRRRVEELEEIQHQLWHALDDGEDRCEEGEFVIQWEGFEKLSALLPEGHPRRTEL